MLVGSSGCGKTTLLQRLRGEALRYHKTQCVEFAADAIDTPGEYLEHKKLFHALQVTCAEADMVVLLHDGTNSQSAFYSGIAQSFQKPVIGVVTKADLAQDQALHHARQLLELAGVSEVYVISSYTGQGIEALQERLWR